MPVIIKYSLLENDRVISIVFYLFIGGIFIQILVKITTAENQKYLSVEKDTILPFDFEYYVGIVVASEIGGVESEAMRAQAVAARTYAWEYVQKQKPISDSHSTAQAFRLKRETYTSCLQAAKETEGEILYYNSSPISSCVYSASNGGRTYSCEEVWKGSPRPYLIVKEDPYNTLPKNGHGVGMSQNGMRNMAKQGFNYKEILNFYYPNTYIKKEVMKMTNAEKIIQWCKERIGCPYMYGATGQDCTPSYRKARMNQYPSYADSMKRNCQVMSGKKSSCSDCKWYDSENNEPKKSYDCAQYTRLACKEVLGLALPSGATSQWKATGVWEEKGEIANMPKDRVCICFRDDKGVKEHVGFYNPEDGLSYHASSHDVGVVASNYTKWTHYAIPKGLYNMTSQNQEENQMSILYQMKVASESEKLNLRSQPTTSSTRVALLPPRATINILEETNKTWYKASYEDKIGYVMAKYLEKIKENAKKYNVIIQIPCDTEEEAKKISEKIGAMITYE